MLGQISATRNCFLTTKAIHQPQPTFHAVSSGTDAKTAHIQLLHAKGADKTHLLHILQQMVKCELRKKTTRTNSNHLDCRDPKCTNYIALWSPNFPPFQQSFSPSLSASPYLCPSPTRPSFSFSSSSPYPPP